MPLTPLSFLVNDDPLFVGWMSLVGAFSMYPLLQRDGLALAYAATLLIFAAALVAFSPILAEFRAGRRTGVGLVQRAVVLTSLCGMVILHAAEHGLK